MSYLKCGNFLKRCKAAAMNETVECLTLTNSPVCKKTGYVVTCISGDYRSLRINTAIRGVAMDNSMYRHHYSRRVRGHVPSENVDILYLRSCILEHFKAYFEGFFYIFICKLSTHKIKSKIIENLTFCIQDLFITWAQQWSA